MLVPLRVRQIVLDKSLSPVVLLVDYEEKWVLPIWIGPLEAQSIVVALEGIDLPRPLTHDLLNNVCLRLGAKVTGVVVHDLKDGTYYAEIQLTFRKQQLSIDARPSDAIALALRTGAEVYMTENVAQHALPLEEVFNNSEEEPDVDDPINVISLEDYKKKLH